MYKTVNFNIFEENLERLIYSDCEAAAMREAYRTDAQGEKRKQAAGRTEEGERPGYDNRDDSTHGAK